MPKSLNSEAPEDKRTDQRQGRKTSKSSAKPTKIKRPLLGRMAFPRICSVTRMISWSRSIPQVNSGIPATSALSNGAATDCL
jgi:hypothetical protein